MAAADSIVVVVVTQCSHVGRARLHLSIACWFKQTHSLCCMCPGHQLGITLSAQLPALW
jgi:hypothetical protein